MLLVTMAGVISVASFALYMARLALQIVYNAWLFFWRLLHAWLTVFGFFGTLEMLMLFACVCVVVSVCWCAGGFGGNYIVRAVRCCFLRESPVVWVARRIVAGLLRWLD